MSEHLAAAIEAGHNVNYGSNLLTTERVILAALPHIRAMIAKEIREEGLIHSMVCGEIPATTPEQAGRDYGLSLGLTRAAQIAEGNQP